MLHINFFGTPQIQLYNAPLSTKLTGRVMGLFAYLTVSGQLQERSTLANLLWDNATEQQAKSNLRYVLRTLRKHVGDYFFISRNHVAFKADCPYWSDQETFSKSLTPLLQTKGDPTLLQAVVNLYQDDFLTGFHIKNASVFEDWMMSQRQSLHQQVVQALHTLEENYTGRGDYQAGLTANRRLLRLEPWNEDAHRQQMKLLAYTDQRSAALEQYKICCQTLSNEYDAGPQSETNRLYEQLLSGTLPIPNLKGTFNSINVNIEHKTVGSRSNVGHVELVSDSPDLATQVNWDAIPITPRLYGREHELAQLEHWISAQDNRVITIAGMSGQGKTVLGASLVTQLAEERITPKIGNSDNSNFDHILWCSLENISSIEQLLQFWLAHLSDTSLSDTSLSSNIARQEGTYSADNSLTILSCAEEPYLEKLFSDLLTSLRQNRCLLILDQVELALSLDTQKERYRAGYEQFDQLLHRITQSEHKSHLLLLSRTMLVEINRLERLTSAVRHLFLTGISTNAGVEMLRQQGFDANSCQLAEIVKSYDGSPLALTLFTEIAHNYSSHDLAILFGYKTESYLPQTSEAQVAASEHSQISQIFLFDELKIALAEQYSKLALEKRKLLNWLAIARGKINVQRLWETLPRTSSPTAYLEAQRSLQHCTLLAWDRESGQLQVPNLILAYTTEHLIETICREILLMAEAVKATLTNIIAKKERLDNSKQTIQTFMQIWSQYTHGLCYLDHYLLLDHDASPTNQSEQRQFILEPIVHGLINQWGISNTWYQLNSLLDFQTEIGLVTDHMQTNLSLLLSCIEPTS